MHSDQIDGAGIIRFSHVLYVRNAVQVEYLILNHQPLSHTLLPSSTCKFAYFSSIPSASSLWHRPCRGQAVHNSGDSVSVENISSISLYYSFSSSCFFNLLTSSRTRK